MLRVREQHIAVFGGRGSGKTVLVSSFYGAAQEPALAGTSLFHLVADNTGQGLRLRQNYLGMKKNARAPEPDRFAATPYSFTIKFKDSGDVKAALRFVWHDYPGEWFEEEPGTDAEAKRRLDTFRSLLRSDVALILVDGQELLDYAGEEEKYLNFMFGGLEQGLLRLREDLLDDGKPLAQFPRIWITALSKADLHPDLDVHGFHDLVVEKAAGAITSLHEVLKGMVQVPQALSLGEDFMLLSSAKFEPGKIEVTERVGVYLLLPVASILPLERLVKWAEMFEIPGNLLVQLADSANSWAGALVGNKILGLLLNKVPKVGPLLKFGLPALAVLVRLSVSKIKEINAEARLSRDHLTATLTQFRLDLEQGVTDDLLVKSHQ